MRSWSLGHLTVASAKPHELVQIAARAGYDAVDAFVGVVEVPKLPMVQLKARDPDTVRFAHELAATGISFNVADAFLLTEQTDMDSMRAMIELVAELGARSINLLLFDPDLARGTSRIATLAEWAGEHGLAVLIEFLAISTIGTVQVACDVINAIGRPNIGLMVDALHLSYSGGAPADLRPHAHLIGAAQICDAPARLTPAEYMRTAFEERGIPGTGELPLAELISVLPIELTCSIEVPRLDEPDLVARAKRSLIAARACEWLA